MYRKYREIQNLDQNFSLKSWNGRKTSPSESSRMTPELPHYKRTDKQFRSLQINTASVLFVYFL